MILESPISLTMVNTFKGVVDFYVWKGLQVARAWPRKPKQPGTPAQQATWDAFRNMHSWIKNAPYSWGATWQSMTMNPTMSYVDAERTFGLRLAYLDDLHKQPDIAALSHTPNTPTGKTTVRVHVDLYASFDPNVIKWRVLGYDSGYKNLEWYESYEEIMRNGVAKTRYEPNIAGYLSPESEIWEPLSSRYTLVLDGVFQNVSIFPIASEAEAYEIMLGPLYDTQII